MITIFTIITNMIETIIKAYTTEQNKLIKYMMKFSFISFVLCFVFFYSLLLIELLNI